MGLNVITTIIIVAVTALLILWDVFVVAHGYKTISNLIMHASREFMAIPLAWGVLGGHFFAFHLERPMGIWWRTIVLCSTGVAVMIWDVWMQKHPYPAGSWLLWLRYPALWLLIGIVIGHLYFPQKSDLQFEYLR